MLKETQNKDDILKILKKNKNKALVEYKEEELKLQDEYIKRNRAENKSDDVILIKEIRLIRMRENPLAVSGGQNQGSLKLNNENKPNKRNDIKFLGSKWWEARQNKIRGLLSIIDENVEEEERNSSEKKVLVKKRNKRTKITAKGKTYETNIKAEVPKLSQLSLKKEGKENRSINIPKLELEEVEHKDKKENIRKKGRVNKELINKRRKRQKLNLRPK